MIRLQLLLVVSKRPHILRKLLLVLLRELGGFLEFLVLAFVLFEDSYQLSFFLDFLFRLLLVLFDLLPDLLGLIVNLLI